MYNRPLSRFINYNQLKVRILLHLISEIQPIFTMVINYFLSASCLFEVARNFITLWKIEKISFDQLSSK